MNQSILKAVVREKQLGTFNEVGSVMGVIYGTGVESTAVTFSMEAINAVVDTKGTSAEVEVELNGVTMKGFIKEIQRKVMTKAISHVDIQIVG